MSSPRNSWCNMVQTIVVPTSFCWSMGYHRFLLKPKLRFANRWAWLDGAIQVQDYEKHVPALFTPNVFSVLWWQRPSIWPIRMSVDKWGPYVLKKKWRCWCFGKSNGKPPLSCSRCDFGHPPKLYPLRHRQEEATIQNHPLSTIRRCQCHRGTSKGWRTKKSPHLALSRFGKIVADGFAPKTPHDPDLKNPTVVIVVDRIDLDAQISATFHASDIPTSPKRLLEKTEELLLQDTRNYHYHYL